MEVLEAIRTRRSIRKYKKDSIPQEKIEKILDAGLLLQSMRRV